MLFERIPGRVYLLTAIIIFAAGSPVTRKLIEIGANNLVDGRNPISFCNVLFVGNLCALLLCPSTWACIGSCYTAALSEARGDVLVFHE